MILTVDEQKEIADEVLIKIENMDRNCIIIGGAPRDWFTSKLDVMIHNMFGH